MTLQKHHIRHIKNWQASGLTQAAYCQKHSLQPKSFSRWFRTYQTHDPSGQPALIPVTIKPAAAPLPAEALQLHLANGQTLELPGTVSPTWLAELLQCLA
jgi:hypothetical protein